MRHTTLLDVFNAAAGFTNQTLGFLTKEKEYELDTEIYLRTKKLTGLQNELINDFVEVNETGGNSYQMNPEAYQQHVDAELKKWYEEAAKAGNGSRYYTDKLNRLYEEGKLAMGARYKAAIVEAKQQQKEVAHEKRQTAYAQNEKASVAVIARLDDYNSSLPENRRNTAEAHAEQKKIIGDEWIKAATPGQIGDMSITAAETAYTKDVQEYLDVLRARGLNPEEYISGIQSTIDSGLESIRTAGWIRNLNKGKARNQAFEEEVREAIGSGDAGRIQQAKTRQQEMAAFRERALASLTSENPEYNSKDEAEIQTWGRLSPSLTSALNPDKDKDKGEKISLTDLEKILGNARHYYGMKGIKHEGMTYEQARAQFSKDVWDTLTAQGYIDKDKASTQALHELQFGKTTKIDAFMGDIGTFIKEYDPQFDTVVLKGTTEAIKLIASKKGLNEDAKRLLTNQVTAELYNRVADLGYTHFDHDQWIAWGKGLAEQAVSGAIFLSNPRNDPSKGSKVKDLQGLSDTKKQIAMIEQAKANPDIIGSYNGRAQFVGHEEDFLAYQEFVRGDVARILGLGERDMKNIEAGWVPEEGRQDDIIALPLIKVTGGPKQGSYRQDVRERNGKKEVITVKYDERAKRWDYDHPVSTMTGEQTTSAAKEAVQEELTRKTNYRYNTVNAEDWANNIQKSGDKRREYETAIAALTDMGIDGAYLDDELYIRGIDPKTFGQLESITNGRYQELLRRHPERREQIIEALRGKITVPRRGRF